MSKVHSPTILPAYPITLSRCLNQYVTPLLTIPAFLHPTYFTETETGSVCVVEGSSNGERKRRGRKELDNQMMFANSTKIDRVCVVAEKGWTDYGWMGKNSQSEGACVTEKI